MAKEPEDDYIERYEGRWSVAIAIGLIALLAAVAIAHHLFRIGNGWMREFAIVWFVAFLMFRVPARLIAGVRRRTLRHRLSGGLCVVCGYDLRASGGHCPECGTSKNGR